MTFSLGIVVALAGAVEIAHADGDVSGTYDASGRTVHLLAGQDELYVSYSDQFGHDHTCTCLARAHADGVGRFVFDEDVGFAGAVEIDAKQVRFKLNGPPDCCGSGWPGLPTFDVASRGSPASCTVKAARAHFYSDTGERKPAYVMKGDAVSVVPAPSKMAARFVLARFVGSKKSTIGLLMKTDLSCGERGMKDGPHGHAASPSINGRHRYHARVNRSARP